MGGRGIGVLGIDGEKRENETVVNGSRRPHGLLRK